MPIFHVDWIERDGARPALRVAIFGPTKELLGIYQEDDTFSKRPRNLIKNMEALLAISDSAFAKCPPAERLALARQFSEVPVPDYLVSESSPKNSTSPKPPLKIDTGPATQENEQEAVARKPK